MDRLQHQLWDRLALIPRMLEGESIFSAGPAFWVNGKQVAHFLSEDSLELRLTRPLIRELRPELRSNPVVELKSAGSDWVILHLRNLEDFGFVERLARAAVEAHLPADGTPPRLPPTGADLEHRRRFH